MIVRNFSDLVGTDRDVRGKGFQSLRAVLDRDGVEFSMHQTRVKKGGPYHWHYKHHKEACCCLSGHGVITSMDTGESHCIGQGDIYILNDNDDHEFEALTEVVLISVFSPALTGQEKHQPDGSYELVRELFT